MASAIDTRRGQAGKTWLASASPRNALRIGIASATPAANAAREMTTVTAFGPAGWWVPAAPIPSSTRFPVIAAVKTFPKLRKQIASYIPVANDSPASSQSRTASSAGVACAAARSTTLSFIVPPRGVRGLLGPGSSQPHARLGEPASQTLVIRRGSASAGSVRRGAAAGQLGWTPRPVRALCCAAVSRMAAAAYPFAGTRGGRGNSYPSEQQRRSQTSPSVRK